jgi:hypothetical protein
MNENKLIKNPLCLNDNFMRENNEDIFDEEESESHNNI